VEVEKRLRADRDAIPLGALRVRAAPAEARSRPPLALAILTDAPPTRRLLEAALRERGPDFVSTNVPDVEPA